jgi:phosphoribosylformylglycinamidine cyclo-ligase
MPDHDEERPISYRDAGVDIDAASRSVEAIRLAVRSTYRNEVMGDIGGFGGMFSAAGLKGMADPVLVSGTDGVGTKLKLAQLLDTHDTVGIDLVAMCVNDILVTGAEPLFFLDYIAIGKVVPQKIERIVEGIAEGCRQAGCSLIGGETAEHPGVMASEDYDLSGFCVGAVDRAKVIDGASIEPGDTVLGLASSGVHSNGFSLVRRALIDGAEDELEMHRLDLGGATLGEALLAPTRIYVKPVLDLLRAGVKVKGMAHITGGGLTENLARCLPRGVDALVRPGSWKEPRVFRLLREATRLPDDELLRTFNMGIGFCMVLDAKSAADAAARLRVAGETVFEIGDIVPGSGTVRYS